MVTDCAPWEPNDDDYVDMNDYLVSLLSSWRDEHETEDEGNLFEIVNGFFADPEASRKLIDAWKASIEETDESKLRPSDTKPYRIDLTIDSTTCQEAPKITETPKKKTKSRSPKRDRRKKKKEMKSKGNSQDNGVDSGETLHQVVDEIHETAALNLDALDDFSSDWEDSKKAGRFWNDRAFGGKDFNRGLGIYRGKDAVVPSLTLAYDGKELLREAQLVITHGHRYGLWGKNGVGKSTLLRRIAAGKVPGWPLHLSVRMVEQEIMGSDKTVRECMATANSSSNHKKKDIEEELAELETRLAEVTDDNDALEEITTRMSELYEELEDIERKEDSESESSSKNSLEDDAFCGIDASAAAILRGLAFQASILDTPTRELSGGWRMKVALAEALCCHPDILLLDEPTNHLDAAATIFLEDYILKHDLTIVVVSHSAEFLDAVCTDMIKFENQTLENHMGNYSTFQARQEQLRKTNTNISEMVARKEKKAMEFIQKQRSMSNNKRRDDNKQRQAKEREKKLGRIGLYHADGKKFKIFSTVAAQHIHGNYNITGCVDTSRKYFGDERQKLRFQFPAAAPLKGATGEFAPLITLDECRFRYGSTDDETLASPWLLRDLTLGVSKNSRIGLLGKNGSGKSTLVKMLSGELSPQKGSLWRHPGLKIAHVSQHHIEHLGDHLRESPVAYIRNQHREEATSSDQRIRQFLGSFGLVGDLALRPIGSLSGGQKARLAFATVLYHPPHVLVLDEPTNHLDRDSLESLAQAVAGFGGAVVTISHHREFLSRTCSEVWTIGNDGRVVTQAVESPGATTENGGISFDALYENYKQGLRKEFRKAQKKEQKKHPNK